MTERYTRNNWGKKNKIGKTPAEQAVSEKIIYNDGISKIIINKNNEFYKENYKSVRTSFLNRSHGAVISFLAVLLITGLIQLFYGMVYAVFDASTISEGAKNTASDVIFAIPFVIFAIVTVYFIYSWITEVKTKKSFAKEYMNHRIETFMNSDKCETTDRDEAESIIRRDMKNQINIYDNGLRTDGKHRMSKELSGVVSVMVTVSVGLIVLNIIIPFWTSLICQIILTALGYMG